MKKILYLYNSDDWTIHNVGKLWFRDVKSAKIVMKNYHKIDRSELLKYDYVWYGYSLMYLKKPHDLGKAVLTVHDPLELFPQVSDWKKKSPIPERVDLLKRAYRVVTASVELQSMLSKMSVDSYLIPTSSLLPLREISELKTDQVRVLSVFEDYPRKNSVLLDMIMKDCSDDKTNFTIKKGKKVLAEDKYVDLLDSHNVYICTSFQEGGPLPALDAMARGMAVITTSVGQIQELVINGYNGFICDDRADFVNRIRYLTNNPRQLRKMRINAIKHIQKNRDPGAISKRVDEFVSKNLI